MRAESGMGESARLLVSALDAVGVPNSIVTYDNTSARQQALIPARGLTAPAHPIDLICVNADQLHHFLTDVEGFDAGRYRIAVWSWEVEKFPDWMARSADLVDEIWTCSAHAAHAIRNATTKPVHAVPHAISRIDARPLSRSELGLPKGFVFLFAFDFDSVFERKNPIATIEAFSRAFSGREDVHLVVKTVRGDAHPEDLDLLCAAAGAHRNVTVRDGYVTREEHQALVAACDAFVSLHRAEGFGLHLAEAMALAKPVVATAYSGNLDFMDESNSRLIPYELVPIPPGCDPYPTDARWAEPDVAAAAEAMREIVDDPALAKTLGERAASDIARLHSPEVCGRLIVDLIGRVLPHPAPERNKLEPPVEDDVLALDEVFEHVRSGPGVGAAKRWAGLSRLVRRNVSRLTRHATEHQQRIDLALTHEINHLASEIDEISDHRRSIEDLTGQVRDLNARLIREREHRRELEAKIRRLDPTLEPGAEGTDERSG
jgi:glycosyltransferase involved in cell wall biosynthesis